MLRVPLALGLALCLACASTSAPARPRAGSAPRPCAESAPRAEPASCAAAWSRASLADWDAAHDLALEFELDRSRPDPSEIPPSFAPGTWALMTKLALFSGYSATIDNDFVGDSEGPVEMDVDLEGRFGGALGIEYYLDRSISLQLGVDRRELTPTNPSVKGETVDDFFEFDDVSYTEYFLAARFLLPPLESLESRRLRPYLRLKAAYVPKVDSSATIHFDFPTVPGFEPIPNPDFDFEGSAYWTAGAELGLAYMLSEHALLHLGLLYERPLDDSKDRVEIHIANFTSELDVDMRPEGYLLVLGLSWGF